MSRETLLILRRSHTEAIDRVLFELIKKAQARCAILVHQDGRCLCRRGQTEGMDVDALAALVAGSFATTREMARIVGEPEFTVLFHQGERGHIHNTLVGEESILAIIFDDRTTIGMVRLHSRNFGAQIEEVIRQAREELGALANNDGGDEDDGEVDADTMNEIDTVFDENGDE